MDGFFPTVWEVWWFRKKCLHDVFVFKQMTKIINSVVSWSVNPKGKKKAASVTRITSQKSGTPRFGDGTEMFFPNHHHTGFPKETLWIYREADYTAGDLDFALHIIFVQKSYFYKWILEHQLGCRAQIELSQHILCVFFFWNKNCHPNPKAASEKLKLEGVSRAPWTHHASS